MGSIDLHILSCSYLYTIHYARIGEEDKTYRLWIDFATKLSRHRRITIKNFSSNALCFYSKNALT